MLNRKLRIVITVDPEIPVPPLYYGGIERIVYMLVCGLVKEGHDVHLFANHESRVPAKVIPYIGKRSHSLTDTLRNALQIKNYIREIKKVDIVHSFSRLGYLTFIMKSSIAKVQSYQRHITPRSIRLAKWLGGKNITFTACSKFCAGTADFMGGKWQVIPNGVNIEKYTFNPSVPLDAPLVFLGRIERIKGVHTAISVAKKTNRRLVIAGNHAKSGKDYEYFQNEVLAHCDQRLIEYIGPVDDVQKNELLGSAAALLFPIEWDEPFGIVMVEALACGTPVIAFSRGSVPEIIKHKITGFICDSVAEMIEAVGMISLVERVKCRKDAEERFSDKVIIEAYLRLYCSCIQK
jgi:glycosyltransferase involved in cell wall biosynthesis